MMNVRVYQWRGVEYKKWWDNSVNFTEYSVQYGHKCYRFDTLKEAHDFIKAHFTLI